MAYILVIDDNDAVCQMVQAALEDVGHEVESAHDGAEGLKKLAQRPADLVITDLYMEGMDGIEFLRELRHTWPKFRALAMSGGRPVRVTECGAGPRCGWDDAEAVPG